ncbi:MAG: hypothetical protein COA94_08240 [Rickettsiales bacterium]|nr:MAG: hypothetical protein COA94_08240 [Rickettsiales bacterium]
MLKVNLKKFVLTVLVIVQNVNTKHHNVLSAQLISQWLLEFIDVGLHPLHQKVMPLTRIHLNLSQIHKPLFNAQLHTKTALLVERLIHSKLLLFHVLNVMTDSN